MPRKVEKLTSLQVKKLDKPGWYADGAGLYLQVSQTGSKSWVYRYQKASRERRHGLGSFPTVSLKLARQKAQECRLMRKDGIDPIEHKKAQGLAEELNKAKAITFKECALAYIDSHKAGWRNRKHEAQWGNTLKTYAYPVIGDLAVQDVDIGHILKILEPIWKEKTETATRVRQRIENILDWAKVRKYRTGENPALWRGHLDKILPKPTKVQKVRHFAAMPYTEVPAYYRKLAKLETVAAKALAFVILTASRNGEARGAKWDEIDLKQATWTIPAERMKAHREHRVPLSKEAVRLLKAVKPLKHDDDDHVFPGIRKGNSISEAALMKQLKQNHPTLTIHGFRSSFRDWCAEMTNYPREVAEAALAHTLKDKTEAAYQRGDLLAKRAQLMDAWSRHCKKTRKIATVTQITRDRKSTGGVV